MKGFWRALILFFAPGAIWAGWTINSFFRLLDFTDEILAVLAGGTIGWTSIFLLSMLAARHSPRPARFYYMAVVLLCIGFNLGGGILRWSAGGGPWEGVWGIAVSAAAAAWLTQALVGTGSFSDFDRNCFTAGMLAAGGIWWYANFRLYLHFLETLFFWGGELLLLLWLLASPLTRRGGSGARRIWGALLLLSLLASPLLMPKFQFAPWRTVPHGLANSEWGGTLITPLGSRFLWLDATGRWSICTPNGRRLMSAGEDRQYLASIPGLLGVLQRPMPRTLLVGPASSVWPEKFLAAAPDSVFFHTREPAALGRWVLLPAVNVDVTMLSSGNWNLAAPYELLMLTNLPEMAYRPRLEFYLRRLVSGLSSDGIAAVPAALLETPAVFSFFYENFLYHGVLPGSESVWVFSNRKLDLTPAGIDRRLSRLYGEDAPLPRGTYELLFTTLSTAAERSDGMVAQPVQLAWGDESFRRSWGDWRWYGGLLLVAAAWRMIRLFGERRGAGYRFWNNIENSFAGLGMYLLCAAAGMMELGISVIWVLLGFTIAGLAWVKMPSGGAWAALILPGILYWTVFDDPGLLPLLLLLIALQSALWTGAVFRRAAKTPPERRQLLPALALGMFLAAVVIGAGWHWQCPVTVLLVLMAAARLPGIWQNARRRVY